jgi:hypothetical protein
METVRVVCFYKKPIYNDIINRFKNHTGLDLKIEISDDGYGLLFYQTKKDGQYFEVLNIYNDEKDVKLMKFGPAINCTEYLLVGSSLKETTYIEEALLLVLKQLGGTFENGEEIEIPIWAKEKWQGEEWWKKVKPRKKWFGIW